MIKSLILSALLMVFSLTANASFIVQTATGNVDPMLGYGTNGISNDIYLHHNFELTETTEIASLGGFFATSGQPVNLFAAFVALSSESDMPDTIDLSGDDVIATTTLALTSEFGYSMADFSLTLEAGWYSLAFGTGKFGASSVEEFSETSVGMVDLPVDLHNDLPFSALQPTFWGLKNEFIFQATNPAFLISSDSAAVAMQQLTASVPEPGTLGLFILLALPLCLRRKS
ncbi:hypothetical protein SG34_026315 [Thalassomonas viridans]|uniref:PEP-CTERM protein-sorting domain-containing protein n=1 Tax=Thalassomonas viridans TaxID=137584 RepID=A0AAF0C8V5_9GAMM|nr:hypothetical protein [Thalassomonas viridans]WDE04786.1 hypothetical protein SG34_026315 [Thalassomonas viridans]